MVEMALEFPADFLWGAATSAYQIEGAVHADGRGESIWDRFAHTPGKVERGETGDVACDHYYRWPSDVDIMAELGLSAYRFSISWPRLFPTGKGSVNATGLAHYDRLIDALLRRGITPVVTLYHWDLPQALQDLGGWRNRDVAERFAEYAATCFAAYGDRVRFWITQNEPWIVGLLGHQLGLHPPGERDLAGSVQAMHHLLLGHGRAAQALRAEGSGGRVGVAFCLLPHYPASTATADTEAAYASDGYVNRWFLDPVLRGSYPVDMWQRYEKLIGSLDMVRSNDMEIISSGTDFIGVNYYSTRVMRASPENSPFGWEVVSSPPDTPATDLGWAIIPDAFTELLLRLRDDYPGVPLLITENGGAFADVPSPDGRVRDVNRIRFLHNHLVAIHRAIERGAPVLGYLHWSLLDNFEWALGYQPRFGLVHVDYETQARTLKDSARYYAKIIAANAVVPMNDRDE